MLLLVGPIPLAEAIVPAASSNITEIVPINAILNINLITSCRQFLSSLSCIIASLREGKVVEI
ncbi:MAG: hypothetical protein ACYCW5_06195 [Thermoleophilia bacterium]